PSPMPPRGSPRRCRSGPRPGATTRRPRRWSTAWTSSTPRWRPDGSWPGTGGAPRRPGGRPKGPMPSPPGRSRQGAVPGGRAEPAGATWRRAIAAFEEAQRLESAWDRAAAALELFDADGRLNDRARASAEIAAALKDLTGSEWSKVRNFLTDPRSL